MKTLYHDGGKLVLEIRSGSLSLEWIKFITLTFVWLLICGGIIAQTRSIRCTKVAPKWTNCQVADTLFWGAMRNVRNANGVQQVVLDEAIGHSDASQYPIYQVSFVLRYAQKMPVTDWERRWDYTNKIQQSLEQFLRSEATTYAMGLNAHRNLVGALVFGFSILINISHFIRDSYQIRLIADKTTHQAILIRQFFLLGTRRKFFSLDQLTLRLEEEKDSDDDRYYRIYLDYSAPPQGSQQHTLQSSRQKSDIQEYWQTNPDLQLLKGFVRCEEKWLG
jgi:hypothetical protein